MKRLSIDDIEVGPMLGAGTVGAVYSGRLKSSGQAVAIKFLQLAMSQDELVRARFSREMAILKKLDHPHIIRYYGGGSHDGQLFYAMEAVHGGTAKELLERFGRLSWQEVASIGRQVSSALQHAHNHGIIHRDLKPGNLFITQSGQIKLGDFGIARDTHSADITHDGLTVGTHAYMSPEQITGENNISGKADLYSLGCVLFELLTGRKPFEGTNFAVLFEQHLRKLPAPVTDFVPDCPQRLNDIILQLLAKNPNDRPFNARTVQGVMIQILSQQPGSRRRDNAQATTPVGSSSDVAAAAVVDPGLSLLARKLSGPEPRQVSWTAIAVVGLVAMVLVAVVVWSGLT